MINKFKQNWKTTIGGLVMLVGLGLWTFSKIDTNSFIAVASIAGAWIGIMANDSKK